MGRNTFIYIICLLNPIIWMGCVKENCSERNIILITDEVVLTEGNTKLNPNLISLAEPIRIEIDEKARVIVPSLDIRFVNELSGPSHFLKIGSLTSGIKNFVGTYECADGVQDYAYWKNEGGHVEKGKFILPETDSVYWTRESLGLDSSYYIFKSYTSIKDIDVDEIRELMKSSPSKGIVLYKEGSKVAVSITCQNCENLSVGRKILLKTSLVPKDYKGEIKWYLNNELIGKGTMINRTLTQPGKNLFVAYLENTNSDTCELYVARNMTKGEKPKNKEAQKPTKKGPDELLIYPDKEIVTWTQGFDSYNISIVHETTSIEVFKRRNEKNSKLQLSAFISKLHHGTVYEFRLEGLVNGEVKKRSTNSFWLTDDKEEIDPECIQQH